MKKVSLFSLLIAMILLNVKVMAQEVLINETFELYSIDAKLAEEATAKGNTWWTTWSKNHGTSEEGIIAYFDRTNCVRFDKGIDQVLLLGGYESGVYELSFDIYIPDGQTAYFNVLHSFNGSGSTYALQNYLHVTSDGNNSVSYAEGHGTLHAGGKQVADIACVYDAWMHFRLEINTDTDEAKYYYTAPGEGEKLIHTWQWSLDSFGEYTVGRKLDAMNFYVPKNGEKFYLDNVKLVRVGEESQAVVEFDKEKLEVEVELNQTETAELNINNNGSSIAEWTAWVDYPKSNGAAGEKNNVIAYDQDPFYTVCAGFNYDEPITVEVGAMYPVSLYANSALGTRVKQLMYFIGTAESTGNFGIEEGTPLKLKLYGQGLYDQPGELIAEKEIPYDQLVTDNWNIVEFTEDEPIILTGYNCWVIAEFVHKVGAKPITFDGTARKVPYSDMYRLHGSGTFKSFSDVVSTSYGCVHVSMTTTGTPETGAWAELDKIEGSISVGNSEKVNVNIDALNMAEGQYTANVVFLTNDSENARVEIPITLNVGEVSLNENVNAAYNIYPNPTADFVTIEAENISHIAIYNSVGQLVNVVMESNTIDMSSYDNGVYYFNIVDNAGANSVQRIVVAK